MYNRKFMENVKSEEWLNDLPASAENIGFPAEAMLSCGKCERTNPPTRLNCFYCGAQLEIPEEQSRFLRPNLRKLEAWENGFNLIIKPVSVSFEENKLSETARILKIEKETLRKIIECRQPLPIARAESEAEAEITRKYLNDCGIASDILSDETLNAERPPARLRGVEFFDGNLILILFNRNEIVEIPKADLILIVIGTIFERRIEATETHSRKGEGKTLDSIETALDDAVIDIYSRTDSSGWRIYAKGFDFSCLETEKGMLAKDNIVKLAGKLRGCAPNAVFTDDYLPIREHLATIWEVDENNDSQGLKRGGIGKFNLGSVTTVNNLRQFTKYSRLQRHLL